MFLAGWGFGKETPKVMTLFADRAEAGRHLASKLKRFNGADTVVYALPRGGVSVGAEIAESLGVPMDVTFAGKVCAPWETSGATATIATSQTTTRNRGGNPFSSPIPPPVRMPTAVAAG